MSENEQIIVLVQDSGDASHGEISVLENWEKAERLIETLLEAGFQGERILVFRGRQNEFQISHRPVVSFGGGSAQGTGTPAAERPQAREPSAQAKQPEPAEEAAEPQPVAQAEPAAEASKAEAPQAEADGRSQPQAEEEPAEAGAVRFSSLFRSA